MLYNVYATDSKKLLIRLMIALIAIIALSGTSCRSKRPLITCQKNDSIVVVEKWRDSIVKLPADSAWLRAWLECDSIGNVLLIELQASNGKNTTTDATIIRKDTVTLFEVNCNTDSLELQLKIRDLKIKELEYSLETQVKEVERQLTGWQIIQLYLGRLFLMLIAALAVLIGIKLYLKR